MEQLHREVIRQEFHPVAQRSEDHEERHDADHGDQVLFTGAIEAHSEPGPDRARPQDREG